MELGCLSFFNGERIRQPSAALILARRASSMLASGFPQADLRAGSASELPWPAQSFDLVTQFTVFTSILDPALKRAVAAEMVRILKPDGAILWFDFRVDNPANSHVRGIPAREIRSLFAGCEIALASALLAPPLGRLIARWSWTLAELLHALPFFRTHYVGLIRKR